MKREIRINYSDETTFDSVVDEFICAMSSAFHLPILDASLSVSNIALRWKSSRLSIAQSLRSVELTPTEALEIISMVNQRVRKPDA